APRQLRRPRAILAAPGGVGGAAGARPRRPHVGGLRDRAAAGGRPCRHGHRALLDASSLMSRGPLGPRPGKASSIPPPKTYTPAALASSMAACEASTTASKSSSGTTMASLGNE